MREGYLTELRLDGTQKASLNADMALRQDWYSGFLFIALEKGYKEGWAFHKFVEKFKSPPDGLRKVAKQPSLSVRSYIRSKQIAFAKARAKAEGYKEMGKRPLY
jgi:hypothetical protein